MKFAFSLFIVICFTQTTTASNTDVEVDSLFVLAHPSLSLRSGPSLDSDVIEQIPFFTKVAATRFKEIPDTIGNVVSSWREVYYQGKVGYSWGYYLRHLWPAPNEDYNKEYRVLKEGQACSSMYYLGGMNWYGLYPTEDETKQELIKLDLEIIFPNMLIKEAREEFRYDLEGGIIKTGLDKKSTLLIGSKHELEIGVVEGNLLNIDYENRFTPLDSFLYPEEQKMLSISDDRIFMKAKETHIVKDSSDCSIERCYELEIADNPRNFRGFQEFFQSLTSDIPHMCEPARKHASYRSPRIVWYGDLDRDDKVDFIIRSMQMADKGGTSTHFLLFLSSEAEDGKLVKKVAEFIFGGCYG